MSSIILWIIKYQLTSTEVIGYMAGMGYPSARLQPFLRGKTQVGWQLMGAPSRCLNF
jgi:hypothetical protein